VVLHAMEQHMVKHLPPSNAKDSPWPRLKLDILADLLFVQACQELFPGGFFPVEPSPQGVQLQVVFTPQALGTPACLKADAPASIGVENMK
jgi:hypothetical protein